MTRRRYRLTPWLVRALIPVDCTGTYVLWRGDQPVYVGRSDAGLWRRLIEHARTETATYFTYDASRRHEHAAFDMECSRFHALRGTTRNMHHPQRPRDLDTSCAFCAAALDSVLQARLARAVFPTSASSPTSPEVQTTHLRQTERNQS